MRRMLPTLLLAAILAAPGSARANDSSATLGAGGLILARNLDVELKSEDLFVSPKEVRVAYRFRAADQKSVTTLVAFPLPDIVGMGPAQSDIALPVRSSPNFVDFKTVVDGKPVATEIEQRVVAVGLDRTEMLKGLKIPLNPVLKETSDALDKLPKESWDELVRLGLAIVEEFDAGKGLERHLSPTWTLKTTFYWQQTFPAGQEVRVEHSYRPVVGYSAGTMFAEGDPVKDDVLRGEVAKVCADKAFLDAARRSHKQSREARIEYILTTGANWAKGIEEFRLVVDKLDPNNLVSFCGEGVKKIGPTQFEMRKTDFAPSRELAIVLVGPKLAP